MQKTLKMTETLANGYSSESTRRELSNEYQQIARLLLTTVNSESGTYPGNHQGVISTPKHKIFGKMTPSCILQDFLYLFESKEIFQKFHS